MRNKGKNQHRFTQNPLERLYAEEWERQNTSVMAGLPNGSQTLDYLLAEEPNNPMGEVTDRDREVAATVIQWLGSSVGHGFIEDVKRKAKEEGIQ
jgi:hypothetical protein